MASSLTCKEALNSNDRWLVYNYRCCLLLWLNGGSGRCSGMWLVIILWLCTDMICAHVVVIVWCNTLSFLCRVMQLLYVYRAQFLGIRSVVYLYCLVFMCIVEWCWCCWKTNKQNMRRDGVIQDPSHRTLRLCKTRRMDSVDMPLRTLPIGVRPRE